MQSILLAVVGTLLVVSAAANVYFVTTRFRFESRWLARETRALDRARAAELRSGEQIDAMLERISTSDRLTVDAAAPAYHIDPAERRFFADDDDPVEDRAWNLARNGHEDEEAE